MSKERLLAYTDAVLAIVITIMVLEFKIPHHDSRLALYELKYVFVSYVLSFAYLTIYRNNHHHMFQVISKISSSTLWANSVLLLCLSLIPFVTWWMAENHFTKNTVVLYGIVLLCAASAYFFVTQTLKVSEGKNSKFSKAIDKDRKGKWSIIIYIVGIVMSIIVDPSIGLALFTGIALIWFIPDPRMEKALEECQTC